MASRQLWGATGVLAVLALPLLLRPYGLQIMITALLWGYLAAAFNLVAGLAGQLSLGHSLFFGAGAYTSTYLFVKHGVTPWIGLFAGGTVAAFCGVAMALLGFRQRLQTLNFALVTVAFALVALYSVGGVEALGATIGLFIKPSGLPGEFQFPAKSHYYYVVVAFSAVLMLTMLALQRSEVGYRLRALRNNERAAQAIGIDTLRYKLITAALSAFFTAAGGTFYAQFVLFINPPSVLGLHIALQVVLFAAVGGMDSLLGPFLGALLLVPLGETLRTHLGATLPGISTLVYGVILVLVMRFMPRGLVHAASTLWRGLAASAGDGAAAERRGNFRP